MKTNVVQEDKRVLYSIKSIQIDSFDRAVLHLVELLVVVEHSQTRYYSCTNLTVKLCCSSTSMYNRCFRAKENMDPLIYLERTKQVTLTPQQNMRHEGNGYTKARAKQEVKRIAQ